MVKTDRIEYYMLNETMVDPEVNSSQFQIVDESTVPGTNGNLTTVTYDCILTEFGRKNWNGRTYDHDIFMKAINNNALFQNDLKNNGGVGSEMSHPTINQGEPNNGLARQMTIDPTRLCALLKKYWEDGKYLKGTFTTVVGGWGDVLRDRILTGIPAMVSSRSIGGVDANGHVLPNLIIICWDHVLRMSSQDARMIPGTVKVNNYALPSAVAQQVISAVPTGGSMSESAVPIDMMSDDFKSFLLSESVSREKIEVLCDTMKLDYDSMVLTENSLQISRIDGNERTTVYMPLNKLIGANAYRLF